MRGEKPEDIKYLENLAERYNSQSGRLDSDKNALREAFKVVYRTIHAHDRWMYHVLEREDVDWSWDALEKTDVSPESRTVYDVLHEFAVIPDKEREWNKEATGSYLKYVKGLLGITKKASKKFIQRARGHFGRKQLIQLVRDEYKTDVVGILNSLSEGKLPGSREINETLSKARYVFGSLNNDIPELPELETQVQKALQTCADKAPFPSGRRGGEYHSYTIMTRESGTGKPKEVEVDYSVALAVGLYQLTKVYPPQELIEAMIKREINGARHLRYIEKRGEIGENCRLYFGPIGGIDDIFSGICTDILNRGRQ